MALDGSALLLFHPAGVRTVELRDAWPVVVGSEPHADVVIAASGVAALHARFIRRGDVVTVSPEEGAVVLVGERPIATEVGLEAGDVVRIGNAAVVVELGEAARLAASRFTSHDAFLAAADEELTRARHFGRAAAVVLVSAPRREIAPLIAKLAPLLSPVDRAAIYSFQVAEILLPEADEERVRLVARALIRAAEGRLRVGAAVYPDGGRRADHLLEAARAALLRATDEDPVAFAPGRRSRDAAGLLEAPIVLNAAMRSLFASAERLRRSQVPVLIVGETGSGKEVLAREIHRRSARGRGPLVCVNCGAIPETLAESILFGHEEGAFTGARGRKRGVFEAASAGTVFLDEVGELPLEVQATLLRVLETGRVVRVGATDEVEIDVRVIAATHRRLAAMVEEGRFRDDLRYRLDAIQLRIPPLRERPEEILPLAERFLREAAIENEIAALRLDAAAARALEQHPWPGNVRELRHAMHRAALFAEGPTITAADLDLTPAERELPAPPTGTASEGGSFRDRVRSFEAGLIERALDAAGGNQSEAARRLRMPLRTLVHKLASLDVRAPRRRRAPSSGA